MFWNSMILQNGDRYISFNDVMIGVMFYLHGIFEYLFQALQMIVEYRQNHLSQLQ